MVSQNLFLCLLLSALAGIATIAGKAAVVNMARRRKNQQQTNRMQKSIMVFQYLFFMFLSNVFLFLAPWFGPVSIYWPTTIASQLISNMIIVGLIMGHEKIDKHSQVATLVVVTAVLYIAINGPEGQNGQDIQELVFGNLLALIWLALLVVAYLACLLLLCFGNLKNRTVAFTETIFLIIATCSSTISATTSKASSTLDGSEGPHRTILIAATWLILVLWTGTAFMEAAHVRSLARYIPQVTFGSILLNALTGVIVWEDYKAVLSWTGYVTAVCLLGMGVYLISDLDFFKAQAQDQQDFHRQLNNIQDFFSDIEEDLAKARLELNLSRHQVTIIEASARQGLTRGASDPEMGTKSSRALDEPCSDHEEDDESDQFTDAIISSPSSTRSLRRGRPSLNASAEGSRRILARSGSRRNLQSIDALSQSFRDLKDLVGEIATDGDEHDNHDESIHNRRHRIGEAESHRNGMDSSTKSLSETSFGGSDMDSVSTLGTNKSLGGGVSLRRGSSTSSLRQQFLRQSSGLLELSKSSNSRRLHRKKSVLFDLQKDQSDEEDARDCSAKTIDCIASRPIDVVRAPIRASSNTPSVITIDLIEDGSSSITERLDSSLLDIENQLDEILDEIKTLPKDDAVREIDVKVVLADGLNMDSSNVSCRLQVPVPSEHKSSICDEKVPEDLASSGRTESTMSSTSTSGDDMTKLLERDDEMMATRVDELIDAIRNT